MKELLFNEEQLQEFINLMQEGNKLLRIKVDGSGDLSTDFVKCEGVSVQDLMEEDILRDLLAKKAFNVKPLKEYALGYNIDDDFKKIILKEFEENYQRRLINEKMEEEWK